MRVCMCVGGGGREGSGKVRARVTSEHLQWSTRRLVVSASGSSHELGSGENWGKESSRGRDQSRTSLQVWGLIRELHLLTDTENSAELGVRDGGC